jgi:IS1 family transposase
MALPVKDATRHLDRDRDQPDHRWHQTHQIALVATAAERYQDAAFRNLDIQRVECDEIWAFCSAKDRNVPEDQQDNPDCGSVWTWVAIDADTKLVPSWLVGDRSTEDCYYFLRDLKSRIRVGNRKISASYVERQNLTMRMNLRRYTRLTNGFSRKVENHAAATALHVAYYNLVRPHQTLTKKFGRKTTPAMAAGVQQYPWSVHDLVGLLDRYEAAA